MGKGRVAVALSGGMDSSVAAYLLKKDGYQVEGVHALLYDPAKSQYHAHLAENICTVLDIPFRLVDLRGEFSRFVVDYFYQEYRRGRTPNPCLACNRYIKFGLLMEQVLFSGIDYMATGHYARIERHGNSYKLLKAVDSKKDQTYFLYMLNQEKLRHVLFPIGDYCRAEVQQIAEREKLPIASESSQDLCFISAKSKGRGFLKKYFPSEPGDIMDSGGKLLGIHQGIAFYTIGQRHGLGLDFHEPLYVIRIDAEENKLFLGEEAELYSNGLVAGKLNWILKPPDSPIALASKIRYRSAEVKTTLSLMAESACVEFQLAQRAVTPGQAVVFYQEEEVLGGGIIERTS